MEAVMTYLLLFPASRRVRLVQTAAETMLRRNGRAAESYLQQRLAAHAEILRRKGIAPPDIAADVARYEGAVRATLWSPLLGNGGAA
jgi:hypothetical protein